MAAAWRCPLCNGPMDYPVLFERLEVCVDCHDGLAGRTRGSTRERWKRADEQARVATLRRLNAERRIERYWNRGRHG